MNFTATIPTSNARSLFYVVRVTSGSVMPLGSLTTNGNESYFTASATLTGFSALDMQGIDTTCYFQYSGSTLNTPFILGAVATTAGTINGNVQTLTRAVGANFFTGSATYTISRSTFGGTWELGEMLLFNTNLTTTQRQQIEGYLAWKWGLQASLPVSHPYYAAAPTLASPGLNTLATLTTDVNSNAVLTATSNIRLTAPTEYRWITSDVSGTSLTLSSNNFST